MCRATPRAWAGGSLRLPLPSQWGPELGWVWGRPPSSQTAVPATWLTWWLARGQAGVQGGASRHWVRPIHGRKQNRYMWARPGRPRGLPTGRRGRPRPGPWAPPPGREARTQVDPGKHRQGRAGPAPATHGVPMAPLRGPQAWASALSPQGTLARGAKDCEGADPEVPASGRRDGPTPVPRALRWGWNARQRNGSCSYPFLREEGPPAPFAGCPRPQRAARSGQLATCTEPRGSTACHGPRTGRGLLPGVASRRNQDHPR